MKKELFKKCCELRAYVSESAFVPNKGEPLENSHLAQIKELLKIELPRRYLHRLIDLAITNHDSRILLYLLLSQSITPEPSLLKKSYKIWRHSKNLPPIIRILLYFGCSHRKILKKIKKNSEWARDLQGVTAALQGKSGRKSLTCVIKASGEKCLPLAKMSLADYIRFVLYSSAGFYSTGVNFRRYGSGGDFITPATAYFGKVYAKVFVELAVAIWQEWRKYKDTPFTVIEIGGGNGVFAANFLEQAKKYHFYQELRYIVIEISPELRAVQTAKLAKFADKVRIVAGDAEQGIVKKEETLSKAALVITNELLDAFPPNKYRRHNGAIEQCYVIPSLPDSQPLTPAKFQELFLTNKDLRKLFRLQEEYLPIAELSPAQQQFCSELAEGETILLQNLQPYVQLLKQLIDSELSCIINVDYGALDTRNRELRTYARYPKHDDNNIYTFPGNKDITFDNNLRYLAGALESELGATTCRLGRNFVMQQYLLTTLTPKLQTPEILERLVVFGSCYFLTTAVEEELVSSPYPTATEILNLI